MTRRVWAGNNLKCLEASRSPEEIKKLPFGGWLDKYCTEDYLKLNVNGRGKVIRNWMLEKTLGPCPMVTFNGHTQKWNVGKMCWACLLSQNRADFFSFIFAQVYDFAIFLRWRLNEIPKLSSEYFNFYLFYKIRPHLFTMFWGFKVNLKHSAKITVKIWQIHLKCSCVALLTHNSIWSR